MEQGRVFIAVALSLLIWLVYEYFVIAPYRDQAPAPSQISRPVDGPEADPLGALPPPVAPATGPAMAPAAPDGLFTHPRGSGQAVIVETDLYTAEIDRRGGRLASIVLKNHRIDVQAGSPGLNLVSGIEGAPVVLPLSLELGAAGPDVAIEYAADRTLLVVSGDERGEIVLSGVTESGLKVEKRLSFQGNSYPFGVAVKIDSINAPTAVGLLLTRVPPEKVEGRYPDLAVVLAAGSVEEKSLDAMVEETASSFDEVSWAGFSGQYFAAVAITPEAPGRAMLGHEGSIPIVRVDAPVKDGVAQYEVLFGPKDTHVLREAGHGLDRVLDFGKFWFVALPLLELMRMIYKVVGNYGVAVIILSALIKVATYPLTQISLKSMRKMQEVQPQLERIKERHKDDSQAMQKEMMELYKRHGVNPFSGCLPMLMQFPIFIGLYNALLMAIELRHAPFVSWIDDLSAPDRLMIAGVGIPVLTLLMGGSMLLQQLTAPAQGDPTQRRMMMFMPVIFTFFFINMPSGLVLYWLVNNVFSIGQQYLTLRPQQGAAK